jgi:hypothetical protein
MGALSSSDSLDSSDAWTVELVAFARFPDRRDQVMYFAGLLMKLCRGIEVFSK